MKVHEIMSRPAVAVDEQTTLRDAVAILTDYGFAALPVIDGEGYVIGVLSEADVLQASTDPGWTGLNAPVSTAFHQPVEVTGPDTEVAVVAAHVRALLADYTGNRPQWTVAVAGDTAAVTGPFRDFAERGTVEALCRTVPGVSRVELIPVIGAA